MKIKIINWFDYFISLITLLSKIFQNIQIQPKYNKPKVNKTNFFPPINKVNKGNNVIFIDNWKPKQLNAYFYS